LCNPKTSELFLKHHPLWQNQYKQPCKTYKTFGNFYQRFCLHYFHGCCCAILLDKFSPFVVFQYLLWLPCSYITFAMSGVIKEVVKGYFFINMSILFVKGECWKTYILLDINYFPGKVDITLILLKYLTEGSHFKKRF